MASESFAKYCEFMYFSKGQGQFILSDYLDLFKKKKSLRLGLLGDLQEEREELLVNGS